MNLESEELKESSDTGEKAKAPFPLSGSVWDGTVRFICMGQSYNGNTQTSVLDRTSLNRTAHWERG